MGSSSLLKGNAFFEKYIRKNVVKYMILLSLYLIGFLLGIGIFNKNIVSDETAIDISRQVSEKLEIIGTETSMAISSYMKQDFMELLAIAILSVSIIGVPIIAILFFIDSISLGITISALIHTNGIVSGFSLSILLFMLPTVIKILTLLLVVCSSLKFIENITKFKKEIKYELVRHAIVVMIVFFVFGLISIYRTFSLNLVSFS